MIQNIKKQWDFSPLEKPGPQEKQLEIIKKQTQKFIDTWKDRTDYTEKPEVLTQALNEYNEWLTTTGTDGTIGYMTWLKTSLDQQNTELKAQFNKIIEFSTHLYNEIQFFILNIKKIKPENQSEFLEYDGLQQYKHFSHVSLLQKRSFHLLQDLKECY